MSFNRFNKIPLLLVCTGLEGRRRTNYHLITSKEENLKDEHEHNRKQK